MRDSKSKKRRSLSRAALESSVECAPVEVARLVDAVPGLMLEAERRRQVLETDSLLALVPVARWAIPRLAAAAVALVAVSGVLLLFDGNTVGRADRGVDTLLLSDTALDQADPVFQALLTEDSFDG